MDKLIEAFTIFKKYQNSPMPISCEHDIMFIDPDIRFEDVSIADASRLDALGFIWSDDEDCFIYFT